MTRSSCCSAELKVSYGSEGTGCYLCAKCGKPCDGVSISRIADLITESVQLKAELAYVKDELSAANDDFKAAHKDAMELQVALKKAGEALMAVEGGVEEAANKRSWSHEVAQSLIPMRVKVFDALSDPTMKRVMGEVGK